MSVGDIAVYLVAATGLCFLALVTLNKLIALARNWREVVSALGWLSVIAAGAALSLAALGAVIFVGVIIFGKVNDQRLMHQCTSLHERQQKASNAPDDYFGRELRKNVSDEAVTCSEFAARKEAATSAAK